MKRTSIYFVLLTATNALAFEAPFHQEEFANVEGKFAIQKTELTQTQWETICSDGCKAGDRPSYHTWNANRPVENVSYEDIVHDFLPRLNRMDSIYSYRLPTRMEWEQAVGYFVGSSGGTEVCNADLTSTVGPMANPPRVPNQFGIYDMYGNVREWTDSLYGRTTRTDSEGLSRFVMGGDYATPDHVGNCIYGQRHSPGNNFFASSIMHPKTRAAVIGFRLVRETKEKEALHKTEIRADLLPRYLNEVLGNESGLHLEAGKSLECSNGRQAHINEYFRYEINENGNFSVTQAAQSVPPDLWLLKGGSDNDAGIPYIGFLGAAHAQRYLNADEKISVPLLSVYKIEATWNEVLFKKRQYVSMTSPDDIPQLPKNCLPECIDEAEHVLTDLANPGKYEYSTQTPPIKPRIRFVSKTQDQNGKLGLVVQFLDGCGLGVPLLVAYGAK